MMIRIPVHGIRNSHKLKGEKIMKHAALSKFHHEMEYAYNAGTTTTLCTVINANGVQIANEKFTAPDPEGDET